MAEVITKHYRVSGRVQGVSFRAFTRQQAQKLGVNGWVRNCADGSVEACASAQPETLKQFEQYLRDGPAFARVDALAVELVDLQEFSDFEIAG